MKHVIIFGALSTSAAVATVLASREMDATDGVIIVSMCLFLGAGIGALFGLKHKWETFSPNEDYGYFKSIKLGPYFGQNSIGLTVRFTMN